MDLHPQSGRGRATADSHFSAGVTAVLEPVQNGACAKTDPLDDGPEDMVRFMRERQTDKGTARISVCICLLYTSDAADES